MSTEALSGHMAGVLLAALEAGPLGGHAIRQAVLAGIGGQFQQPSSTFYSTLSRLGQNGLIQAIAPAADGQPRVYELTPAGQRALDAERAAWREFSTAVKAVLDAATRPPS
jgi:PadR family transcriptional regulator PadR